MVENKELDESSSSSDPMATALEAAKPIIAKISFGSIMGYCSGYALKKIGKAAAVILGCGFIAVQTCVSYGYLEVDWNKVKDDAVKKVDTVSFFLLFVFFSSVTSKINREKCYVGNSLSSSTSSSFMHDTHFNLMLLICLFFWFIFLLHRMVMAS